MADFEAAWRALFAGALRAGASDVHLTPGAPAFFRVDGALSASDGAPWTAEAVEALLAAWTTPAQRARLSAEGAFDFARDEEAARLRVNAFAARGGTSLAIRLVPRRVPALETLGVPPVFSRLLALRHGLVLVSGRAGAGKTTTLAAYLHALARARTIRAVTLEDPIEYVHDAGPGLVSQRELGVHFASFAAALKSALREDPDVILVGELRDADTVQTALSAAETGHLVLASLHTRSAAEAAYRLESFFPADRQAQVRAQLAAVLEAMVSQELLPGASGGRALAAEVLVATPAARHLIRAGKAEQLASCILSGAASLMQTRRQSVERLLAARRITPETARRCLDGER